MPLRDHMVRDDVPALVLSIIRRADKSDLNNALQNPTPVPLRVMHPSTHNFRPYRKEKEPEKFDGRSVDWKDYFVYFEQCADWNRGSEKDKAQQLSMSLRGTAQKLLGDMKPDIVGSYERSVLAQRFKPKERVTAYRCEFRSRIRKAGESLPDFGYALRRFVKLATRMANITMY